MNEAATSGGREPDLPTPAYRTTDGVLTPLAAQPDASGSTAPGAMDGLGGRLKELRQQAGLSLRELARQADVSPSLISQIENGKSRPSVSTLYTLARLLNVPVNELFDATSTEQPPAGPVEGAPAGRRSDPANAWRPSEYTTRISVVHPAHRAHLQMAEGIQWERLAATPERDVNFMKIT